MMRPIYWGPCLFVVAISLLQVQESIDIEPTHRILSPRKTVLPGISITPDKIESDGKGDFPTTIGASIAGAEFGSEQPTFSNANPGIFNRDYTYPGRATIEPLTHRGIKLMRVPIRWERLQPVLNGELNPKELARLDETIRQVRDCGGQVIIDLHNYCRYRLETPSGPRDTIIDQIVAGQTPVTRDHLAQFWHALATRYGNDPTVIAYGLMNEPHDMGRSDWNEISQASVDAIRTVDSQTWLLIAGDSWSSAEKFARVNGPDAWIDDIADRVIYEAHCYLDHDSSGRYMLSYADELEADPSMLNRPTERLQPFIRWCQKNRVRGFVGEFGVPVHDRDWNNMLVDMNSHMKRAGMGGCLWAAGPWWGDYLLSIEIDDDQAMESLTMQLLFNGTTTPGH